MIWILITVVAIATYFDLRFRRIPNWLTYPALAFSLISFDKFIVALLFVGIFSAILFGKYIGSGDIKLSVVIAAWSHIYGFSQNWIFISLIIGGLAGFIYRRKTLPFAPYLAIGVVIANVAQDYLIF